MERRNFLKLFPFAGIAAVFGVKLKAEPEFNLTDVRGVVLKGVGHAPTDIPWDNIKAATLQDLEDLAKMVRKESGKGRPTI